MNHRELLLVLGMSCRALQALGPEKVAERRRAVEHLAADVNDHFEDHIEMIERCREIVLGTCLDQSFAYEVYAVLDAALSFRRTVDQQVEAAAFNSLLLAGRMQRTSEPLDAGMLLGGFSPAVLTRAIGHLGERVLLVGSVPSFIDRAETLLHQAIDDHLRAHS